MKTIDKNVDYVIFEKASKFIACLRIVENKDDIEKLINEIKNTYKDARHYPYAYIIGNNKKCSDDKEPSNTAGLPLLDVLEKNNLNNVLVVVVRYFGGTLLGAGLLTRTYAKSVIMALKQINIKEFSKHQGFHLTFNYNVEKEINYILKNETITKKDYVENISYETYIKIENESDILTKLNNIPNIKIEKLDIKYL